ncbi:MAG: phage major capsid protein [Bacteroides sp.]|nr:phage major capsid protein [Eubacterium sp.]MCM1419298.1 phage major capsid protein [Roseburia sp.]MCM1463414.1 phage major capsid protein [Bacteroides sp.]
MKNLDAANETKSRIMAKLASSIREQDETKMSEALGELSEMNAEQVKAEAAALREQTDRAVLSGRGLRALTTKETEFYQKLIADARSADPRMEITGVDAAFPETIITQVVDDIVTDHPLLSEIDFVNTSIVTKWILNAQGEQRAKWGPINSEITKELNGAIKTIDMTLCKLSAFMYLTKDMLDLGPAWLDVYVRRTLSEATLVAIEVAVVDGTGNEEPIGMTRNVADDVSVTGGVYPRKTAEKVTQLDAGTYGKLLAEITKTANGHRRAARNLILVVNPTDYFKIVMPATTALTPNGAYVNDVLPVPTKVIQSVGVPEGQAVVGLAKEYFLGIGTSRTGRIEYSDEYKFLEDLRTYIIKFHGNGKPKDNNAFMLLDISELKPSYLTVKTISGDGEGNA